MLAFEPRLMPQLRGNGIREVGDGEPPRSPHTWSHVLTCGSNQAGAAGSGEFQFGFPGPSGILMEKLDILGQPINRDAIKFFQALEHGGNLHNRGCA
jgi:hypothetical protein